MPLAAVAGISAIGSIGSALIGSHAASSAADVQQQAAQKAAQIQQQGSNNALNYNNAIYGQTEQNLSPYIQSGTGALDRLNYLLGVNPNQSVGNTVAPAAGYNLSQNGTPQGGVNATGTPALPSTPQAMSQPSTGALSPGNSLNGASAALSGTSPALGVRPSPILSTPTSGAVPATGGLQQFSNGLPAATGSTGAPASGSFGSLTSGYGQTFQAPSALDEQNDPGYQARLNLGLTALDKSAAARGNILTGGTAQAENQAAQDYASNEYNNVYNRALGTFNTNYGVWNNDQNNTFNRLMGLSNAGQNAATAQAGAGQASSNNAAQNILGTGQQIGQDYGNAAAANASGIVGGANAWSGALGNTSSNLSNLLLLRQLQGGGSSPYIASDGGAIW